MQYDEMLDWLRSLDKADRLPVWVISYKRAGSAPLLNKMDGWGAAPGTINVLVRESQFDAYALAYPGLTIHALPDEEICSCGQARWGAAMLAYELGQDVIIQMDDDVLSLDFLFKGTMVRGASAGAEKSAATSKRDRVTVPDLEELILGGFSSVARDVLEKHPDAMLGGMIKRHMSFDPGNHQTKYILNGGVTPRQVMVYATGRMLRIGVAMPPEFYIHGEDIGMNATVLARGGACFSTPSFVYDHWPESINIKESTIRSAETAKSMHAEEYEALQRYPIKDYLRTKRSILDGSPEWNDVSWSKFEKVTGRKRVTATWASELL